MLAFSYSMRKNTINILPSRPAVRLIAASGSAWFGYNGQGATKKMISQGAERYTRQRMKSILWKMVETGNDSLGARRSIWKVVIEVGRFDPSPDRAWGRQILTDVQAGYISETACRHHQALTRMQVCSHGRLTVANGIRGVGNQECVPMAGACRSIAYR